MRRSAAPAPTGVGVVVYPLRFVSEHSETLVELDIDYRHLAEEVPGVHRPTFACRAVGTHPLFIARISRGRCAACSTRS